MRKQILIVNYDFPPALSGVRRVVKFARYLPQYGYHPVVLAANPPRNAPQDPEALADVESRGYPVFRTRSLDPEQLKALLGKSRSSNPSSGGQEETPGPGRGKRQLWLRNAANLAGRIPVPDDRIGWYPFAVRAAERILSIQDIDYLLTSSYPNTSHLIGLHLHRKFGLKWIADFRDGWTQNPYFGKGLTPLHGALNRYLERKVVKAADAVLAVSEPIVDHLASLADDEKVYLVPNGFDEEDFLGIQPLKFEKFTIAYTGTLFMQRSPENFFAAVRGLLDTYPGISEQFQVIFRTQMKPEHERDIVELGIQHVIRNWGLGTYREALQLQLSADALLVMEGEAKHAEIMLTQKVFEYAAAGKPVICIAPPSALAQFVKKSGIGVVLPPENVFRIKETLYEAFNGQLSYHPDRDYINGFSRRKQAADVASVLDSL
jgi:glycosyltransferase involved in cell wall biosynthesis